MRATIRTRACFGSPPPTDPTDIGTIPTADILEPTCSSWLSIKESISGGERDIFKFTIGSAEPANSHGPENFGVFIDIDSREIEISDKLNTAAALFDATGKLLDVNDDGDSIGAATVLTASGNTYTKKGVIAEVTDRDFFQIEASGPTTITVDVDEYVNNLDAELCLYKTDGSVVQSFSSLFDATITQTLTDGTYYICVRGQRETGTAGQYTVTIGPALAGGLLNASSSILRRLIQEGVGGFSLADIGEDGAIATPEQLRDALDGLDNTDEDGNPIPANVGNVTLDDITDVDGDGIADLTFDVQVIKSLGGSLDLAVDADVLGAEAQLGGALEIRADVELNLVFGVDASGFFVQPNGPDEPEVVVSNLSIDGDVSGSGRLGFIGGDLTGATLAMDPEVAIALKLHDPGTDLADGLIRLHELDASANFGFVGIDLHGGGSLSGSAGLDRGALDRLFDSLGRRHAPDLQSSGEINAASLLNDGLWDELAPVQLCPWGNWAKKRGRSE